jgi:hypothetical protein
MVFYEARNILPVPPHFLIVICNLHTAFTVSTPVLVTADTLPLECCYLHPSLVPNYSIPPMKDYVKRVEVKMPPTSELPASLPTNKSSNPLLGGSKPAPPLASKSVHSSAMSSSHAKSSSSGGGAVSSAGKPLGGNSAAGKTYSHIPAVADRRGASGEVRDAPSLSTYSLLHFVVA